MGTTWYFKFFEPCPAEIEIYIRTTIRDFEQDYSRFLETSLLSQLNRNKRLLNPPPELLTLLEIAQEYYDLSEGYFNIATETHQRAQGYDAAYSFREHPELHPKTLDLAMALQFDPHQITLHPEATLDLGGLGKGFLIDRFAWEFQQRFNLRYFVINGGGDIYATSNHGQPLQLHLRAPATQQSLGRVSVKNTALCASSPVLRSWGTRNHLVNPFAPEKTTTKSAFVLAPTATEADIWATVATLVSEAEFERFTKNRPVDYQMIEAQ